MGQMFRTKMGADKQSRDMCTEYARDTIEQLWLQWGLEKQMSISKEGVERESNVGRDKVEYARQKMAELKTDGG